jgi:two-component system phosphate regulon sensor histidine kinase PhoR
MTSTIRKNRTSRLHAIRAYLLIVLISTLLLFSSSVASLRVQLGVPLQMLGLSAVQANREIWFIGLSIFMLLSVLAIGLFLFVRVTWDIRWLELRSDFVSGVSHQFKTPLSLIRLYSETLAQNEQDFSPEDRRNYIRIIARESERMSRLIDNVLDFSKMENAGKTHELPEGDLTGIISQAINDYSEYLIWAGFDLKASIQPQLPRIRFNPEQVSQMIVNLLDNARKYSGSSRLIQLRAYVRLSDAVIEVQDKGIGIPEEEKENIFQPFYRIATTRNIGGCGLGLYLVAKVMKEHGGKVEVQSEVNRGSIFRLIFPIGKFRKGPANRSSEGFWTLFSLKNKLKIFHE